ncbi:MAG TPA: NUDIX hydrolase [Ruminococcaceae bacterium]|nr:NUDIX hydrolase [Oscillospiraceae bacterium]
MEIRDAKGLTEREFLEAYAKKDYPRPYLTADIILFSENKSHVLLVKRKGHPYIGKWALPGGFARSDEKVSETASRELYEETGIDDAADMGLEAVGLFSKPGRDPRGWVVSEAYMAMTMKERVVLKAGDDAAEARWFRIVYENDNDYAPLSLVNGDISLHVNYGSSDLAFDHGEILIEALKRFIYRSKE